MRGNTIKKRQIDEYLGTYEAAEYLNERVGPGRSYTAAALKALRRQQKGPPYYRSLGKQILYTVPDLDFYIQSCRVEPEKGV